MTSLRTSNAIVLFALLLSSGSTNVQPSAAAPLHVERLAEGVYAVIRHDPEAMANNSNSLVVVGANALLVVDAQFTRAATLQTLSAIRRISALPVKYVVNTHWHDDHVAGNQVYRDTFPNVEFVSHANTRRDLATLGAANRRDNISGGEAYVARLERLMSMGLGFDSTALAATEAEALRSTVTIMRTYIAESPEFRPTPPTTTFDSTYTIALGTRSVVLKWFGPANTAGDAVVFVPEANIVATGDLVVYPVPFAFNSHVGNWINALDSLTAAKAAAYVPGHGPVLHDLRYISRVRTMLASILRETRQAVTRGDSLPAIRRAVTLADDKRDLAGNDKWKRIIFDLFFVRPAIGQAFGELSTARH